MIPLSGLGSGQYHPDSSGVRGDPKRKERPVSGDDYPYDKPHGDGLGATYVPGGGRSSARAASGPPVPKNVSKNSPWNELGEALGIPSSVAQSSRMGNRMRGMAVVQPVNTSAEPEYIDYDELEKAGSSDTSWENANSIMDFLCRLGDDVEISISNDVDDDVRPELTWRGLVAPEDR